MSYSDELRASRAIGAKDYAKAIEIYEELLEDDQDHPNAPGELAMWYERLGDYENSIRYANIALEKDPTSYTILMVAARYWSRKNDEGLTYHFACRVLKSSQYEYPKLMWFVNLILGALSIFKKGVNAGKRAKKDQESYKEYVKDSLRWANEIKNEYEAKHGAPKKQTHH